MGPLYCGISNICYLGTFQYASLYRLFSIHRNMLCYMQLGYFKTDLNFFPQKSYTFLRLISKCSYSHWHKSFFQQIFLKMESVF